LPALSITPNESRSWRADTALGKPPGGGRHGDHHDYRGDAVVLTESCEFYDPDVDGECDIIDRRTLPNEVKDYINKRPSPR
jgi:hypothetical protein